MSTQSVWVFNRWTDGHRKMPYRRAEGEMYFIIPCYVCGAPACTLDTLFPFYWEDNRCRKCEDGAKAIGEEDSAQCS